MNNERGIVLAQVLLLTLLTCLICASIARLRLQPSAAAAGAVGEVSGDLQSQSAVNRVNEVWARLGSCASDASDNVVCSGSGCDCACDVGGVSVRSTSAGGSCVLTVAPPEG